MISQSDRLDLSQLSQFTSSHISPHFFDLVADNFWHYFPDGAVVVLAELSSLRTSCLPHRSAIGSFY